MDNSIKNTPNIPTRSVFISWVEEIKVDNIVTSWKFCSASFAVSIDIPLNASNITAELVKAGHSVATLISWIVEE